MNWNSLLAIHIWIFVNCRETTSGRLKRIINGEPLTSGQLPGYFHRYFVWIGYSRDLLTFTKWRWERQACGGTLLTPRVVQSACHCFSDFQVRGSRGTQRALKNSHSFDAVFGCRHWQDKSPCVPKPLKAAIIHQACAKKWGWISYDFALLGMEAAVSLEERAVTIAPLYSQKDMLTMWERTVSKRSVCLMIGFGRYISRNDPTKSKFLRHGWQSLTSFAECYEEYTFQSTNIEKINMTDYWEFVTWSCLKPFGRELGTGMEDLASKGDSGSPIICDNHYFALVSQGGETFLSHHTNTNDLVFFPFANTVESRKSMEELVAKPYFKLDPSNVKDINKLTAPPISNLKFITARPAPRNFNLKVRTSGQNKIGISTHFLMGVMFICNQYK